MIGYYFNWPFSFLASLLRLGAGAARPTIELERPLILYEFEGCPYCRIAREAVSASGVVVEVRPCPKGGVRYRPQVAERGGKAQFPYLIDPNTNASLYESGDIARYLRRNYGGVRPAAHWLGPMNLILSQFGVLARLMAGTFVARSRAPAQPLAFYGAERSPSARLVKERLCAMELPYVWRSERPDAGSGPRIDDPNTNESIEGAPEILQYLRATYRS